MDAETNEAFLACRLILLDESPDLRPVGKGEAARKISEKFMMKIIEKDVTKAEDHYS